MPLYFLTIYTASMSKCTFNSKQWRNSQGLRLKIFFLKGKFSMKCHIWSIFMDILDEVLRRRNGDSTKKTFDKMVFQ